MPESYLPKVIGEKSYVRLFDGKECQVVHLNNAATTPPFETTLESVTQFLKTYGALHRGAGPHASITVKKVEVAVATIRRFLHLGEDQALLFNQNTSGAINFFARLLNLQDSDVILTSEIEHTSNSLPWKYNSRAQIICVRSFDDGSLDYDDLETKAREYEGKLKWVVITGASNLTGYIPDIAKIVQLAHQHGAKVFVDAAQLAPHRPIDVGTSGIDALAFSAHKLYAPFGLGILVMPNSLLEQTPVDPGGGSIDMLNAYGEIIWAPAGSRHQAGTWNAVGIIALASSCQAIMNVGWDEIVRHEREITQYAIEKLAALPDLTLYVPAVRYFNEDRIGTIPFNLSGYHHALVSAILEHEYGIETRAGTICNHRLVRRWFNITDSGQSEVEEKIARGDRLASYGICRISVGIQNNKEDIDTCIRALKSIIEKGSTCHYKPNSFEETYQPTVQV